MSKQKIVSRITSFLLGAVRNFDFTDADGLVLFSTDKDDDSLAVGDAATPDGTFELPDGRMVTIADGVVTDITGGTGYAEVLQNQVAELSIQLERANRWNGEANRLLREAQAEIEKLSKIRSNAKIQPRIGTSGRAGRQNQSLSSDERKAAIRTGIKGKKGGL